jgi:histidyl-tRNA synthetase
MSRPHALSGYPEWLPAQRAVEQSVLDTLRRTFELHGFAGIETRAVEPLSTLLRKGEIDKEVYVVRRLHADDVTTGIPEGDDTLALHFDLTVPFARYVLENAGHLTFPFRRYQIQKAWRGERPQEGRYREFCQADVDVIDRDTLAGHHEVEVAAAMADALSRLPLPPLTMQVNNRRLIEGYYAGLGVDDAAAVMRHIDKLDKAGPDEVGTLLADEAGLTAAQVRAVLALARVSAADASLVDQVQALGVRHPLLDQGLAELVAVVEGTVDLASERFRVVADLRIARGLDYYTGTVYETRMAGFESLGSVCSGGRYDALASDGAVTYPGVGLSFGVTRAVAPLLGRGMLTASRSVPTCVLVAVASEAARRASDRVAAELRRRGIPTEVAPSAAKYGKQIRHADRRGIPYVWFPAGDGAGEEMTDEVKDIRSGDQAPADAATWSPPPHDLTVEVLRP